MPLGLGIGLALGLLPEVLGSGGDSTPFAGTYYVANSGSDSNTGHSAAYPKKTLAAALARMAVEPGNLSLNGGDIFFEPLDWSLSGAEGSPIVVDTYGTGRATISAGVRVQTWTLVDAPNRIWRASLSAASYRPRGVWVNGQRCKRARTETGFPSGTTYNATGYDTSASTDPGFLSDYTNPEDLEIVIRHEWMESRLPVASVVGNQITIQADAWAAFSGVAGVPVSNGPANRIGTSFIENGYEDFEANAIGGTFYQDRPNNYVFLIPPAYVSDPNDASVIAAGDERILALDGIADVTFDNITFAHSNNLQPVQTGGFAARQAGMSSLAGAFGVDEMRNAPSGVLVHDSTRIRFENCIARSTAAIGFALTGVSEDCEWVGCISHDTGMGGWVLGRTADFAVGTCPTGTIIENCVAQLYGADITAACGITRLYAGTTSIQNNEVRMGGYTNISVGIGWGQLAFQTNGNANCITSNNRIWGGCRILSDGGGLYSNSVQVGHLIEGNFITDIGPSATAGSSGVYGIYLDDGSRYNTVSGNVIARCQSGPMKCNNNIGNNTGENNTVDAGSITTTVGPLYQSDNTFEALDVVGITAALLAGAALGAGLEAGYASTLAEADALLDFWNMGGGSLRFLATAEYIGTLFADGAQINPFPDFSGYGNDISEADGAKRFVYEATGTDGVPVVQATATRYITGAGLALSASSFTMFAVAKSTSLVADQLLFTNGDAGNDGVGYFLTGGNRTIIRGGTGLTTDGAYGSGEDVVVFGAYEGTQYMFVNGVEQVLTGAGSWDTPSTMFTIGHPSVGFQGEFRAIGYFSEGMPPTEAMVLAESLA